MKQIYAFETKIEYEEYEGIIERFSKRLDEYQKVLEKEFALTSSPRGIIWTTEVQATTVFSEIPIPAYTNDDLIYMSPDINNWRKLFVRQLDGKKLLNIQKFYENYSENQLFIILAHELTHHSDLFLDEFDDERKSSIWFEEGMCFYLPRKLLLNEKEFNEITVVESKLVEVFKVEYRNNSLEDFGSNSYQSSLSSIMFDYWRSYLAVKYLVEVYANNDVKRVFDEYRKWDEEGRKIPLTEYFHLNSLF